MIWGVTFLVIFTFSERILQNGKTYKIKRNDFVIVEIWGAWSEVRQFFGTVNSTQFCWGIKILLSGNSAGEEGIRVLSTVPKVTPLWSTQIHQEVCFTNSISGSQTSQVDTIRLTITYILLVRANVGYICKYARSFGNQIRKWEMRGLWADKQVVSRPRIWFFTHFRLLNIISTKNQCIY